MSPQNNCCETWVEKTQNTGLEYLPYKITAKELDEETGLYYYGARYLDPKYSMWISTDPALGDYIPKAPINEEAKKYNQNLPGMGGVFNHINGDSYAYAGNNPVKYTDPDGEVIVAPIIIIGVAIFTGYKMLPKHHSDGFLYFDNTQPQRVAGYYNTYENFTSNNIACNIDSLRTDFKNTSGKKSTIWLWKGNYNMVFNGGWHTGAEVGAYGPHGGANDKLLTSVSFELKNKNTGDVVSRTANGQYWTNRFDKGKCTPADLLLTGTLTFRNESDAKAYCDSVNDRRSNNYFNSKGREQDSYKANATRSGKIVTVTFE